MDARIRPHPTTPVRRTLLAGGLAAFLLPTVLRLPAFGLTPPDAQSFVADVVREVITVIETEAAADRRAEAFMTLFRRVAALSDIGRFTLGTHWRQMNGAQQAAFLDAFERYAVRAYTRRIGEYNGQTLEVNGATDMGRRGVLVRSLLKQPGAQDLAIEWLVSDRNGSPQVVDIVAEGVSLSIAQREEFAGMIERRGGDYDRFITDLDALG